VATERLHAVERTAAGVPVRRVRKAYEQVADQLRELIAAGELARGERLPNEQVLAAEFGVSRATVREALRLLAAQNLIRTAKGAGGGSYVTLPSVDHLSSFLTESISLLTESRDLTLDELLEARSLLEVPAARLAAERRDAADVERLLATIPAEPLVLTPADQFERNKDFHSVVLETCGNALLVIAAQPIFSVLQTHLARSGLGRRFHAEINAQHRRIAAAIEAGDAGGAAAEMDRHLDFQRAFYERAWRDANRRRAAR
jgi:DNA-binding FadR family transcriptional regulator